MDSFECYNQYPSWLKSYLKKAFVEHSTADLPTTEGPKLSMWLMDRGASIENLVGRSILESSSF